jgi:tetratricopeptide (TPR) repeat protein
VSGRNATEVGTLMLALAIALGTALAPTSARADSLRDVFARGNAALARGDSEAAVREYEALLEAGIDDADVSFNLASAYGNLGRYGQAIRHFERALRLEPGDSGAKDGLRSARAALGERQAEAHGEAIVVDRPPLDEAIFSLFSADTLAVLLLVSVWLGTLSLIALRWLRTEALRLGVGIGSAVALGVAVFSCLGVFAKADWGRAGKRAVIVREGVAVREAPDDRARMAAELAEGESVRLLGTDGRFARVQTRTGQAGYVPRQDVGEL